MIHGYLVLLKKSGKEGPLFPVKNDLRIGRGIDCDVRIHVQSVSNHHCLVSVGEGVKARIINLSSTSRTLVNGVPIKSQGCTLTHGDSITVGERLFRWFEGQRIPLKKRRKSEADTLIRSHNIAVVTPLHHKRRTVGPAAASGLWCGAPKTPMARNPTVKSPVVRTPSKVGGASSKKVSLKTSQTPSAKTPASKTPTAKTPASKTPTAKTPASKTPTAKTPASKTPTAKTPVSKTPTSQTPASKTLTVKTPASKTPAVKTPASKTPAARTSVGKSPSTAVPEGKASGTRTPARKSSVSETPRDQSPTASSPAMKTPAVKSSVSRLQQGKSPSAQSPTAKSPAAKTVALKSPVKKTPAGKSSVRTPRAKSLSLCTSAAKASSTSRRSSSGKVSKTSGTPKPVKLNSVQKSKDSKGQKRRLSSPYAVASKRVKIESPKSIDKKKMAALSGIHRKSLNIAPSSTLATVKVVLSSRKTPIIKAMKTPHGSTLKKKNQEPKSSIKKARRPLFSEIVKKKAVQIANAAAKKSLKVSKEPPKASKQLLPQSALATEIPPKFSFTSRGNRHVNSPEPIFIGRKVAKTPLVTRKGRKDPFIFNKKTLKEKINLSGVSDMFKTPVKLNLEKSRQSEGIKSSSKQSITTNLSSSLALLESSVSSINRSKRSSSPVTKTAMLQAAPTVSPRLSKSGLGSSNLEKSSHRASPLNSSSITSRSLKSNSLELKNTPESSKNVPTSSRKLNARSRSAVSAGKSVSKSFSEILPTSPASSPIRTPSSRSRSQVLGGLSAKRGVFLLTSTPAAVGRRQPSVGSAFESPSSLLTAQTSSPQSPASGRKSRLDVVEKIVPFIYSPHASPGKSSLKTSPSRSPPSGGHGKGLSVSFSDNIHVQMLLSVSKKGNKTAVTRSSSISPISEGSNSVRTPDLTTFDFNSIKTPNVPKEMFVSSILSSGASNNSIASGSAKRKGRAPRSPQSEVSNLQVRRFLKSSASPSGYVDVKGVKRLMAASCKTPTYLAVEGVKKLFGDAAAAAGNELSNFAGVRELFASPSPKMKSQGRLPAKETPEVTSLKQTSPVAKIQAEVEGKKAPSFTSKAPALRGGTPASSSPASIITPPRSGTSKRSRSNDVLSSKKSPSVAKSEDSAAVEKTTPVRSTRNVKRISKKKVAEENLTQKTSPSRIEESKVKVSPIQKRTRKAAKVFSPSVIQSPPKRTTRRAAKSAVHTKTSPVPTKSSKGEETGKSPSLSESKRSAGRSTKQATLATKEASQDSPPKTTPVKKVTRRAAVKKHSVSPIPSPVKSPVKASKKVKITTKASSPVEEPKPKGRTRRGAKANSTVQPDSTSTKAKSTKRELSSPASGSESSSKKSKQEIVKVASPQNSPLKRGVTRRTRKVASPEKTSSTEQSTSSNAGPKSTKRKKIVSFDDESASPVKKSKKGATTSANVDQSSELVSPGKNKASKRTVRSSKKSSPQIVSLSPRRTRSRK